MNTDIHPEWNNRVQYDLSRLKAEPPKSTEDVAYLADLYALSDRFNAEPIQESVSAVKPADMGDFERYMGYVSDELTDMDKYIQIGEFDIARDEGRHAVHFIDKAKKEAYTQEQRAAIREAQSRLSLMEQAIKYR